MEPRRVGRPCAASHSSSCRSARVRSSRRTGAGSGPLSPRASAATTSTFARLGGRRRRLARIVRSRPSAASPWRRVTSDVERAASAVGGREVRPAVAGPVGLERELDAPVGEQPAATRARPQVQPRSSVVARRTFLRILSRFASTNARSRDDPASQPSRSASAAGSDGRRPGGRRARGRRAEHVQAAWRHRAPGGRRESRAGRRREQYAAARWTRPRRHRPGRWILEVPGDPWTREHPTRVEPACARIAGLGVALPAGVETIEEIEARIERESPGACLCRPARSRRSAASGRGARSAGEYASTLAAERRCALEDAGARSPTSTCSSSLDEPGPDRARNRAQRRARAGLPRRARRSTSRTRAIASSRDPGRGGRYSRPAPRGARSWSPARPRPSPRATPSPTGAPSATRSSATRWATLAGPSSSSRPTTSAACSTATRGPRRALGRVDGPGRRVAPPARRRAPVRGGDGGELRDIVRSFDPRSGHACTKAPGRPPTTTRCSSSTR